VFTFFPISWYHNRHRNGWQKEILNLLVDRALLSAQNRLSGQSECMQRAFCRLAVHCGIFASKMIATLSVKVDDRFESREQMHQKWMLKWMALRSLHHHHPHVWLMPASGTTGGLRSMKTGESPAKMIGSHMSNDTICLSMFFRGSTHRVEGLLWNRIW
jgi:hypothetical protein